LPPPTPTAISKPQLAERAPVATILLVVPKTEIELASVVQWQDITGAWNDVDGWRGAISNGKTIWWVEEKDWGAGPFRWVVYQQEQKEQTIVAISEPFSLPARQGEIKQIPLKW
jgi:hypothetical protein